MIPFARSSDFLPFLFCLFVCLFVVVFFTYHCLFGFVCRKKLKHLDRLNDSELSPEFVEEVKEFLEYVYTKCPVKKLETGQAIHGRSKLQFRNCLVYFDFLK